MRTLDFNPNKKPTKPEWATYVPYSTTRPEFKIHKQKNFAVSAMSHTNHGILYQWVDDEWKEIFRLEDYKPPTHCELCEKDLRHWYKNYRTNEPYYVVYGHRKWTSTNPDKMGVIYLCWDCAKDWKPEK